MSNEVQTSIDSAQKVIATESRLLEIEEQLGESQAQIAKLERQKLVGGLKAEAASSIDQQLTVLKEQRGQLVAERRNLLEVKTVGQNYGIVEPDGRRSDNVYDVVVSAPTTPGASAQKIQQERDAAAGQFLKEKDAADQKVLSSEYVTLAKQLKDSAHLNEQDKQKLDQLAAQLAESFSSFGQEVLKLQVKDQWLRELDNDGKPDLSVLSDLLLTGKFAAEKTQPATTFTLKGVEGAMGIPGGITRLTDLIDPKQANQLVEQFKSADSRLQTGLYVGGIAKGLEVQSLRALLSPSVEKVIQALVSADGLIDQAKLKIVLENGASQGNPLAAALLSPEAADRVVAEVKQLEAEVGKRVELLPEQQPILDQIRQILPLDLAKAMQLPAETVERQVAELLVKARDSRQQNQLAAASQAEAEALIKALRSARPDNIVQSIDLQQGSLAYLKEPTADFFAKQDLAANNNYWARQLMLGVARGLDPAVLEGLDLAKLQMLQGLGLSHRDFFNSNPNANPPEAEATRINKAKIQAALEQPFIQANDKLKEVLDRKTQQFNQEKESKLEQLYGQIQPAAAEMVAAFTKGTQRDEALLTRVAQAEQNLLSYSDLGEDKAAFQAKLKEKLSQNPDQVVQILHLLFGFGVMTKEEVIDIAGKEYLIKVLADFDKYKIPFYLEDKNMADDLRNELALQIDAWTSEEVKEKMAQVVVELKQEFAGLNEQLSKLIDGKQVDWLKLVTAQPPGNLYKSDLDSLSALIRAQMERTSIGRVGEALTAKPEEKLTLPIPQQITEATLGAIDLSCQQLNDTLTAKEQPYQGILTLMEQQGINNLFFDDSLGASPINAELRKIDALFAGILGLQPDPEEWPADAGEIKKLYDALTKGERSIGRKPTLPSLEDKVESRFGYDSLTQEMRDLRNSLEARIADYERMKQENLKEATRLKAEALKGFGNGIAAELPYGNMVSVDEQGNVTMSKLLEAGQGTEIKKDDAIAFKDLVVDKQVPTAQTRPEANLIYTLWRQPEQLQAFKTMVAMDLAAREVKLMTENSESEKAAKQQAFQSKVKSLADANPNPNHPGIQSFLISLERWMQPRTF